MLVALMILMLGGGSDVTPMPADFDKHVKDVVVDEDRRREILAVNEAMGEIIKSYAGEAQKLSKEVYATNRSYASSPADLEAKTDAYVTLRAELDAALIEKRLELARLMTKEEWDEVMSRCMEDQRK